MRQRQGTILKKCGCVKQARWSDERTLRHRAGGRPRELSFAEAVRYACRSPRPITERKRADDLPMQRIVSLPSMRSKLAMCGYRESASCRPFLRAASRVQSCSPPLRALLKEDSGSLGYLTGAAPAGL